MVCMSNDAREIALTAANQIIQAAGIEGVEIALVLGSGWSSGADQLGDHIATLDVAEIAGFSQPVVAGHGGQLRIVTTATGKIAAVFTGRTHLYEGLGTQPVVHGVRTAAALGAKTLVLTNGCGGLNPHWPPGTVVMMKDHINLTGDTALVGPSFIDMTEAYSLRLRDLVRRVEPDIPEGVYVQFRGPSYETPAEVKMAGIIGGDLVGMSTALETIAAREAGLEVLGLSLITNAAAGLSGSALDHHEVLQAGSDAGPRLADLLARIIKEL